MNRREMLKRTLGVSLGGGLLSASSLQARTSETSAPVSAKIQPAYLVEATAWRRSVEVGRWPDDFPFDKSDWRLLCFYCSQPPRPMTAVLTMGLLSRIIPFTSSNALDRSHYLSCVDAAWRCGPVLRSDGSFHSPDGYIRTQYVVASELNSSLSRAFLKNSRILAAYDTLDQRLKLRPYSETRIQVESDHVWYRRIRGSGGAKVSFPVLAADKFRRSHERELCDFLSKHIAQTSFAPTTATPTVARSRQHRFSYLQP